MDEEADYWIPRNLDAPKLFFKWELDSAIIFITILIVFGVLNMTVTGLVLAVLFGKGYAHLKEEGGRGLLMRVVFWYFPSDWLTRTGASHIREYLGG